MVIGINVVLDNKFLGLVKMLNFMLDDSTVPESELSNSFSDFSSIKK